MTELLLSGPTSNEEDYDKDQAGLVQRAKDWFKQSSDHSHKWREAAKECYDLTAGEQLDEAEKQQLREQLRPEVAFNRAGAVIDAVEGHEINNRQEARYFPREVGDAGVSEVLTGAGEWVRDECDAEDEETEAFKDVAICGMGWTETRIDHEEDLDGKVLIDRIDPIEMYWDPDSKKQNLSDARWIMRVRDVNAKDGKALWSNWPDAVEAGPWDTPGEGGIQTNANEPDEYRRESSDDEQQYHRRNKRRRVIELQWWEREPVYRIATPNGIQEFSNLKFSRLREQIERTGLPFVRQTKKKYYRAFITGSTVLEEGDGPCEFDFSLQCITGKRDRNSNTWYGLIRQMKDPQQWANKFLMQIMHILNTNSKGGVLYEQEAVVNPRKFEEDWAKADSAIMVNQGAISNKKIQEKPKLDYPAGLDRLMEFCVSSIYQVPGINLEMMGLTDRNQPGVLEYQRREAGMTVLAGMFNSLRRYRKKQGRVLLYFIQEFLSDGRLIRIVGDQGMQYIPLVKDPEVRKYDVIVDEAASSPNQKERTFQILLQLLPVMEKMGLGAPPELLDFSPLPRALVEKWKEGAGGASPEQIQQLQQQLAKVLEENQKLESDQATEFAKIAVDEAVQRAKLDIERRKTEEELDIKRYEAREGMAIKRMQTKGNA